MKLTTLIRKIIKDQSNFYNQMIIDKEVSKKEGNASILGLVNDFGDCKTKEDVINTLNDYGYDYNDALDYLFKFLIKEEVDTPIIISYIYDVINKYNIMDIKDYNFIIQNTPEIDFNKIKDYYSEALEREGNTNKIQSVNWNELIVDLQEYPNKYFVKLTIVDCGVKTAEMGWEELSEVVLGFSLHTKQWTLLM